MATTMTRTARTALFAIMLIGLHTPALDAQKSARPKASGAATYDMKVTTPGSAVASPDSILEYLLASAASDFHKHGPKVTEFRKVRFGYSTSATGERHYMLCGEFSTTQPGSKADWTPFATLKTSGYEQYVGATTYCAAPSAKWQDGDLSSTLASRLKSVRSK